MLLRLILLAVCCTAMLGLGFAANASHPAPRLKALRLVESPAKFIPPKRPKRAKMLSIASRAVALARAQLGVPYVSGGASPAGFDCSGLVMWAYARLGISLPHNAAALYGVGRPVPTWRLRPGDLLFFHGLGHVGIYIGRGRMIHAPQTGSTVEIQSLASRRGLLVGARRVVAT
jgi:cell wall-associated NlpC family hydrolase